MKCPYCNEEMQHGVLRGDGRSRVRFVQAGKKHTWADDLAGIGVVKTNNASGGSFWKLELEGDYCEKCKKLILDAEVSK